MLEVLLLVFLGKRIARMMRNKGRSPVGYVFMLVGLWIGGEILGAFGTAALAVDSGGPGFLPYIGALAGAALGATTAFAIAAALAPVTPPMVSGFPVLPPAGGYVPPGMYPPGPNPVQPVYPPQSEWKK